MIKRRRPPSGSTSYAIAAQVDTPRVGGGVVKGLTAGQVTGRRPRTPSESVTSGATIATPPPPPPATTTTTTLAFKPDASWWSNQFGANERFRRESPMLRSREEDLAAGYGYNIARNAAGQPMFRSKSTGASGITQALDEKGNPLVVLNANGVPVPQYKDASGKLYSADDLEMDIQRIERGKAGYLQGAFGSAEAGSEKRQFEIGDVAARTVGAKRSGMRAQAGLEESQALQNALAGLTTRAARDFGDIQTQYRDLYDSIYRDLLKDVAATPGTEVTTTTGGGAANNPDEAQKSAIWNQSFPNLDEAQKAAIMRQSSPKPTGAGRLYERRGPWQYLGKSRGWVWAS